MVIAIASGKGGVGKSMLAVACAYELSLSVPTLLIDLDFFNRGLSGLFAHDAKTAVGAEVKLIARPQYLDAADMPPVAPWEIIGITGSLFHVRYPDLLPDELVRLEGKSVDEIQRSLREFLAHAAEICGCRAVVLDCHGGPDRTSFAAAVVADHTLLVSEPDRITLHGTLNFLRQLLRSTDAACTDVRLVFNKVIPAFRAKFLHKVYDAHLRKEFADNPLLAVFPLELPLTRSFEETSLLTASYPHSLLAKKMRVLLRDLIGKSHPGFLSPATRSLPSWLMQRYRSSTSQVWRIFDTAIPLGAIVAWSLVLCFAFAWKDVRIKSVTQHLWRLGLISEVENRPQHAAPLSDAIEDLSRLRGIKSWSDIPGIDEDLRYEVPEILRLDDKSSKYSSVYLYNMSDAAPVRAAVLKHLSAREERGVLDPPLFGDQWRESVRFIQEWESGPLRSLLDAASENEPLLLVPVFGLVVWLGVAYFIAWSIHFDRGYTCASRQHSLGWALAHLLAACLIWQLPSYLAGTLFAIANGKTAADLLSLSVPIALICFMAIIAVHQSYQIYRDCRYEHHPKESLGRLAFVLSLPAALLWALHQGA